MPEATALWTSSCRAAVQGSSPRPLMSSFALTVTGRPAGGGGLGGVGGAVGGGLGGDSGGLGGLGGIGGAGGGDGEDGTGGGEGGLGGLGGDNGGGGDMSLVVKSVVETLPREPPRCSNCEGGQTDRWRRLGKQFTEA